MRFRVAGLTLVFVLALVIPTTASAFTSVPAFRSALQRRINHFRAEYGRGPVHLNLNKRARSPRNASSADECSADERDYAVLFHLDFLSFVRRQF